MSLKLKIMIPDCIDCGFLATQRYKGLDKQLITAFRKQCSTFLQALTAKHILKLPTRYKQKWIKGESIPLSTRSIVGTLSCLQSR